MLAIRPALPVTGCQVTTDIAEHNHLASLLIKAACAFAAHPSQIGIHASTVLRNATTKVVGKPQHTVEQCSVLPLIFQQYQSDLLTEIEQVNQYLHWSDTGATVKAPDVQQHLAYVELVGPAGMIADEHCKVGLLLQKPNAVYPNHKHAAEELYLVVSGKAMWSQSGNVPTERLPGEFIHHASWEPHAMNTNEEPMLSFWCWTGDIRFDQYEMI